VFSYLKSKSNYRLIFDTKEHTVGKSEFVECDWSDFYAGAHEMILPNALKPLENDVTLKMLMDSSHSDKVSGCSWTEFVIFWQSKKKTTVKNSVFGAEFFP
jgi:hypothetical protein